MVGKAWPDSRNRKLAENTENRESMRWDEAIPPLKSPPDMCIF